MARPCRCGACRLCWLYQHDRRYAGLWGGGPAGPTRPGGRAPCRHLGPGTGQTVACPTCRGHVELKLFACSVHGRCTTGRPAPGVACCLACPDYRPPSDAA